MPEAMLERGRVRDNFILIGRAPEVSILLSHRHCQQAVNSSKFIKPSTD
jgi:hypothetical protein